MATAKLFVLCANARNQWVELTCNTQFTYLFVFFAYGWQLKLQYWHLLKRLAFHENEQLPDICDINKKMSHFNASTISL